MGWILGSAARVLSHRRVRPPLTEPRIRVLPSPVLEGHDLRGRQFRTGQRADGLGQVPVQAEPVPEDDERPVRIEPKSPIA
jgi:hypothetical protein